MQSFHKWLEAVLTKSGTGINNPPTDNDNDDGGDEEFWRDEMHGQISKWVSSNSPCVKKCLNTLTDNLLNAPTESNIYENVVSYDGGFVQMRCSWVMDLFHTPKFDKFENELKHNLLSNCDIWKSLNIGYEKAWNAVEDSVLLYNIVYNLCSNKISINYITSHTKFHIHELAKNNINEIESKFVRTYNNRFKTNLATDRFKFTDVGIDGSTVLQGKSHFTLLSWAFQRFAVDLVR